MADRLYCAAPPAAFGELAWHGAVDATEAGGEALVLLQASGANPDRAAAPAWWQADAAGDTLGQAPQTVTLRWQVSQRLCCWSR